MNIRLIVLACIAALLLCAPAARAFESEEYPVVEQHWGQSYQQAQNVQIANPEAGAVQGPVEGLDGKGADKAMDAYHESFSKKEAAKKGYSLDTVGVIMSGGGR